MMFDADNQHKWVKKMMLTTNDKERLEAVGQKFRAAQAPYHMMVESLLNPDPTLLYMACLHDDGRIASDERILLDWFKQFSAIATQLTVCDRQEMINSAFDGYYSYRTNTRVPMDFDREEAEKDVSVA